jgi:glycerophosphoryl diester phosphodiesterase
VVTQCRPCTGSPYLDEVRTPPGGPLAIAHRGGAKVAQLLGLENTIRAFRHAVGLGYRYLETDVHASRDGTLFAFHDSSLHRVTGEAGRIGNLDAARISGLYVEGEPVPRMDQLLEEFPDARFNIDIKAPAATQPLADLLARTGAAERVCVSSFDTARIRRFRQLTGGTVTTGASRQEIMAVALGGAGFAHRLRRRAGFSVIQVPYALRGARFTRPGLVRRAHAAGLHVHVWTVDDPHEIEGLIDMGVDGIFTDRTDVLKDVLTGRGLWREHR